MPNDVQELDFLKTMIKMMKLKASYISEEEWEDKILGHLIGESRKTGYSSKDEVIKALE